MKILVTNHHLQEFTGSEISTFILSKYLKKAGHNVVIYSKYLNFNFTKQFENLGIRVISNLDIIHNEQFDIAHIQQNISAYEIRYYFPKLPFVMWIHGVLVFLELPPFVDLHISKFLVNNAEGCKFIQGHGIKEKDIHIIRNIIDSEIFFPTTKINKIPKKALIISNKITKEKELLLKKVLKNLKIKYTFVGKRFKNVPNYEIPKYINKADIVFTVGLGAMETMFCGRIPILYDYNFAPYDDGMVNINNFDTLKEFNFSGRATKNIFDEKALINEIKKYNYKEGEKLREKALRLYDATTQVDNIINIYKNVIENYKYTPLKKNIQDALSHIVNIIYATKFYTTMWCQLENKNIRLNFNNKLSILQTKLDTITSSKCYRIWRLYHRIIDQFKK